MQVKDLQTPLANHFKLTPEEVNAIYNSGNGNVFRDRISAQRKISGGYA